MWELKLPKKVNLLRLIYPDATRRRNEMVLPLCRGIYAAVVSNQNRSGWRTNRKAASEQWDGRRKGVDQVTLKGVVQTHGCFQAAITFVWKISAQMSSQAFVGDPTTVASLLQKSWYAASTLLSLGNDTSLTRNTLPWPLNPQQRRHRVKELSYIILKPLFKNRSDQVGHTFFFCLGGKEREKKRKKKTQNRKALEGLSLAAQVERVGKGEEETRERRHS